jgi:hypothetical protein
MAETPVVAQSPVSLNIGGSHKMIPSTVLYFDDSGALKADRWPEYAPNAALVDALLARLKGEGVIRAGLKPATRPAFLATAVTAGSVVLIEIETAAVVPDTATPANSKADFKVTETETYTGLEPGKAKDKLGTTATDGKNPGLVFISSASAPSLPKAGTYVLAGDPGTINIPKNSGSGDAFVVQARAGGADGALTSVEIKDVDTTANKFTLIAKWTKSASATAMTGLAAAFAYAVTITAPSGGFLAPAPGKVTLTSGSDPVSVDPVKSSATVPAQ